MTFVLSKLLWFFLRPSHLLLMASLVAFWRHGHGHDKGQGGRRAWYRLGMVSLLALIVIGLLPIGALAIRPLEERFARPDVMPERVDGIIVLGGAQIPGIAQAREALATNENAERLIEGLALARRYPEAKLVFSGGSGRLGAHGGSEAVVNEQLLGLLPVMPAERVFMEDRSRNTYENALFSKELVQPAAGEIWLMVTSAYHMPRSVGIFRHTGWEVVPYPVDYRTTGGHEFSTVIEMSDNLVLFDTAAKEWVGLVSYYLLDRTNALFPAPE